MKRWLGAMDVLVGKDINLNNGKGTFEKHFFMNIKVLLKPH